MKPFTRKIHFFMFRAHVGEREKKQIKHLLEQDSMSLQWNVQIYLLGVMELNGLHSMLWGNHTLSHKILHYRRCINTCTLRNMCTKLLSRAENRKCLPISTVCRANRIQTRNSSLASVGLWHSPWPCQRQWLRASTAPLSICNWYPNSLTGWVSPWGKLFPHPQEWRQGFFFSFLGVETWKSRCQSQSWSYLLKYSSQCYF